VAQQQFDFEDSGNQDTSPPQAFEAPDLAGTGPTLPAASTPDNGELAVAAVDLRDDVLSLLSDSDGTVGIREIQSELGFTDVDPANPLANPVNAALASLRDAGRIIAHTPERGEPSFELPLPATPQALKGAVPLSKIIDEVNKQNEPEGGFTDADRVPKTTAGPGPGSVPQSAPDRAYLTADDVAALTPGDTFHIDSGLGGAFEVEFTGYQDEIANFNNRSPDFQSSPPFRIPKDKVKDNIFRYGGDESQDDEPQAQVALSPPLGPAAPTYTLEDWKAFMRQRNAAELSADTWKKSFNHLRRSADESLPAAENFGFDRDVVFGEGRGSFETAVDVTESISFQLTARSNTGIRAVGRIYLKNVVFDDIDADWRAR